MKKTISILTLSVILTVFLFGCGKNTSKPNDPDSLICAVSIDCLRVLENMDSLNPDKIDLIPSSGIILPETEVSFKPGETAFDVLKKVCRDNKIHLEFESASTFNTVYIEGINNLYAFDCGEMSGWMYTVNGSSPNCGCDGFMLNDGDSVRFSYACTLEDYSL